MCDWSLPAGVDTPSAYTVTTVPSTTQWTTTWACLDTTVTGNGTSQFYVGWTAQVDMAPAIARLAEGGNVRDAWTYGATEWMVSRDPDRTPPRSRSTSKAPSTVAGTGLVHVHHLRGRLLTGRPGDHRRPRPPLGVGLARAPGPGGTFASRRRRPAG